MEEPRCIICTN